MSRKVRAMDVAQATAWYYGIDLDERGPAGGVPKRVVAARRCAYRACRELGFTWSQIALDFNRDHTTVIAALSNGHEIDPDDVAAVLANARARALADSEILA